MSFLRFPRQKSCQTAFRNRDDRTGCTPECPSNLFLGSHTENRDTLSTAQKRELSNRCLSRIRSQKDNSGDLVLEGGMDFTVAHGETTGTPGNAQKRKHSVGHAMESAAASNSTRTFSGTSTSRRFES